MGGGQYDPGVYASTIGASRAAGTNFQHTKAVQSGQVAASVHELLDPRSKAGPTSPLAGQIVHEARDSDDHPVTVPVIVCSDQTGSMGIIASQVQGKFVEIFSLFLRKGYLEHPALSVGAYGDMSTGAYERAGVGHEVAPLQISQFEADNRADEALDKVYLEGNGGGNDGEHATGVWLYAALHTATDAWEKRQKKGYLFTVGDEKSHPISREQWAHYVDPDTTIEGVLTQQQIADMAKEKWEVYHLVINNPSSQMQQSVKHYEELLGRDHVVQLEDPAMVAETIALIVGMGEGMIDLDQGLDDLADVGLGASRQAVGKALATVGAGRGAVAVADAPSDLATDDGASRL
jgi:hypothetical protein